MNRIFHGTITGDRSRPAKEIGSFNPDLDIKVGDLIGRWDHYFIWDGDCVRGRDLEGLRGIGDETCDRVVTFLGMGKGDMLEKLEGYMSSTRRADWVDCVDEFWRSVETEPADWIFSAHGRFQPSFNSTSDPGTLSQGQQVFWKYVFPILTSLLHFSIAGLSIFFPG